MEEIHIGGFTIPFNTGFIGMGVELVVILLLAIIAWMHKTKIGMLLEMFYEGMYNFIEEVVGEKEKKRIKSSIVTIFFVVFLSNMLGRIGDILNLGIPHIEERFSPFSAGRNGVFAMSVLLVLFTLIIQLLHLGPIKFLHEYIPITGKNFLATERGNMPARKFYPIRVGTKLGDLAISLFIGALDIIGLIARVISLAFRLFGNMFAGTVLLGLLAGATAALTNDLLGIEFPIIFPLILYVQGLLVAFIQAFVVTLLTSVFVKMAKAE